MEDSNTVQSKPIVPEGYSYDFTSLLETYLAEYIKKQNGSKEQHEVVVELYNMMSPEQKKLIKDMVKFITRPRALPTMIMTIELQAHHAKVTICESQTPSVSTNPLEMDKQS